jgi:hypothetical protein
MSDAIGGVFVRCANGRSFAPEGLSTSRERVTGVKICVDAFLKLARWNGRFPGDATDGLGGWWMKKR